MNIALRFSIDPYGIPDYEDLARHFPDSDHEYRTEINEMIRGRGISARWKSRFLAEKFFRYFRSDEIKFSVGKSRCVEIIDENPDMTQGRLMADRRLNTRGVNGLKVIVRDVPSGLKTGVYREGQLTVVVAVDKVTNAGHTLSLTMSSWTDGLDFRFDDCLRDASNVIRLSVGLRRITADDIPSFSEALPGSANPAKPEVFTREDLKEVEHMLPKDHES